MVGPIWIHRLERDRQSEAERGEGGEDRDLVRAKRREDGVHERGGETDQSFRLHRLVILARVARQEAYFAPVQVERPRVRDPFAGAERR